MTEPRQLADLDRAELAVMGREYLMAGHLIDRAGMGHVVGPHGLPAMTEVAIDEWMGASPIYTRRMQRLLAFEGNDVATIFKGMQFDIGAPHEFLDFRYRVIDETHGEFWLDHCGALMDVEPMGDDFVVAMCHHIEDPTFDATAIATNPRAQVRPVHRPPRADTTAGHEHCRWTVEIPADAPALPEPEPTKLMATTLAAQLPLPTIEHDDHDDGFDDYTRPLDPDLRLEDLSAPALRAVIDELALQGHLLSMSFLAAVEARFGTESAVSIGTKQSIGIAGLTAWRFRKALRLDDSLDSIAQVVALHPALLPRSYVDLRVEVVADELTISIGDCPALHETARVSWISLLADGYDTALSAIVAGVDRRARCEPVAPVGDAVHSWRVVIDEIAAPERNEVVLTRFSTGADWQFQPGAFRTAVAS